MGELSEREKSRLKILLINPPSTFLIDDNVFPSLGLLYLSAYLKANGYKNVEVLDLNGKKALPDYVDKDILGFYSNTPQFPEVIELLKYFREINKNKRAVYAIGGPHVSGKPEDAIIDFDVIVVGEGEKAILDILKLYAYGHRFKHDVVRHPYIKDIDEIPFPDRDVIDIKKYHYLMDGKATTTLITSRGCPFQCAFCANNAWGKTIRMRSPGNVIGELKLLIDKYGYRSFMFFDDTMTINRKRMITLCEMIKGLKVRYRCFVRSDTVDKSLLDLMKRSGCEEVGVGMESGSQRILNLVNKGQRVEDNMRVVRWCKDIGIRVKGFFVIGFPGENMESVNETINFIEEADLYDFDITVYTPYPGSKIYKDKKKYDIKFENNYEDAWYKGIPGFYRTSVSTSALNSEDIIKIRGDIEAKYKKRSVNAIEIGKNELL